MKKIISLALTLLLGIGALQAQQEEHYTQFMYNKQMLNAGYVGSRDVPSLSGIYRNQWLGFDRAPVSQIVSFNSSVFGNRVGMGLSINHNTIGIQESFYGSLAYSYKIQISPDAALRVGLQANVRYLGMDFRDQSVIAIDQVGDDVIQAGQAKLYNGNFGAGLYFSSKRAYAGVSIPHLLKNDIRLRANNITNQNAEERRHVYVMTGASLPIGSKLFLEPNLLGKYVPGAPIDADANLTINYNNFIKFGLSYRMGGDKIGDSVDGLIYIQATKGLGIGAAYDYTLSQLNNYNKGSIEILARYDFYKKGKDLTNPRLF